jgi:hypothetical protein
LAGSSTTMPNSLTSWSLIRGSSAYSEMTTYVPTYLASVPSTSRAVEAPPTLYAFIDPAAVLYVSTMVPSSNLGCIPISPQR